MECTLRFAPVHGSPCGTGPGVKMAGLSYMEVLVATFLIAITLVPALEALRPAIQAAGAHESHMQDHYQLAAKLEAVLAEPLADLDAAAAAAGDATTPTSYSDTLTYADGRQITRQVYLSRYDGDNADGDNDPFTGTDSGLLWVRVAIPGTVHALETLLSQ